MLQQAVDGSELVPQPIGPRWGLPVHRQGTVGSKLHDLCIKCTLLSHISFA